MKDYERLPCRGLVVVLPATMLLLSTRPGNVECVTVERRGNEKRTPLGAGYHV